MLGVKEVTKAPNSQFPVIRTAVIVFQLICGMLCARADEKLPILEVGMQIYSNVTVTAVTATDVYFKHDKGVANAKLKNLDAALQKHFHYDPTRAEAAKPATPDASAISAVSEQTIDRKNAQQIMDDALARVKAIINQPVTRLPRTPDMHPREFQRGWYHPGAIKPDYKNVDIRTTQDTKYYADVAYVTSDVNPGVVFVGPELEFNSMTKFFYVDRNLPKKKLTEAEMLEINRLYRTIGTCEEKLQPPSELVIAYISGHRNATAAVAVSLGVLLVLIRLLRSKQSE